MLWRLWCFVCGLPAGALVVLGTRGEPGAASVLLLEGALVGGVLLLAVCWLLARWRDDEPERGLHLASAAGTAWLALPAGFAIWLDLAPGAWLWVPAPLLLLGAALFRGAREIGPATHPVRWVSRALGLAAAGAVAAVLVAGAWAAAAHRGVPEPSERWSALVYDMDAAVPTRPLPPCERRAEAVRVLLERGAHPSLSPDGRFVWFDAAAEAGRRQIHRLERATGEVRCWTCGEPGHNVRPHAGDSGLAVVFETDRGASWLHPDDTDVHLIGTGAPGPSRRLTFSRAADERPLLGPGSRVLIWSRRAGGAYEVVASAIRTGHGGLLLGNVGVLAGGGAAWAAPLGWSPDGRTLIVGTGNPFAPVAAFALDPATGETRPLGEGFAPHASFLADGAWVALATTTGGHWAGALPDGLGFVLGPWARSRARTRPLLRGTELRIGPPDDADALAPVELPAELTAWGAPTGVALAPDGRSLVLGQRREEPGAVAERLVEIDFACGTALPARAPARPAGAGGEPAR